ncbi:hypothetical protein [Asanoa siamensis]|uniref:Uncharacterized protein n=1 Tax=Asanoa siamensis TaxID=926357 RepID=A0ABQ4CPM6_9ACTN|nr:hypothetical protein [Asanoa siamensis]GIF73239.1 hypothetical protein Asi02nite_27570 [Asanoa siamensis]
MSSQAEIPSADKSDSTQESSPRHAKRADAPAATGVLADVGPAAVAPGEDVKILPIVPPAGTNAAPSQTGAGTEWAGPTAAVPTITGLDTMAGPETAPATRGDGALSGVATAGTVSESPVMPVDAPPAGGTAAPADGAEPSRPAGAGREAGAGHEAGAVSVERLPTRLSLNKARHAAAAQTGIFRLGDLHSETRPVPENSHMLGICAWGTALALAGVGVGIRGLAAIISGIAPAWYKPALIGVGLIGVLLTVGAFVTIQRRYMPWLLLAFATLPLAVTIALTIIAL